MVNSGPSTACERCRERNTRCDRVRPGCGQCARRNIACPGYRTTPGGLVFKDQSQTTARRYSRAAHQTPESSRPPSPTTTEVPVDVRSTAIQFFFAHHVATTARQAWLSRGHFDHLESLYRNAAPDSALATATETMAACAMLLQFEQDSGIVDEGRALTALQRALNDPVESLRDETLLAILCLDHTQHLVSARTRRPPSTSHTNGAVMLVEHRARQGVRSNVADYLVAATQSNLVVQNYWRTTARDQAALERFPCPPAMFGSPMMRLQRLILCTIQESRSMQHLRAEASQSWRQTRAQEQFVAFGCLKDDLQTWSAEAPAEWQLMIRDIYDVPRPPFSRSPGTTLNLQEAHVCGTYLCVSLMVVKFAMVTSSTSTQESAEKARVVAQTRFMVERILNRLFEILAYIKTLGDIHVAKDILTRQLADSLLRLGPSGLVGGTALDARLNLLSLSRWALSVLSFKIPGSESFGATPEQMSRLAGEFREASRFMEDAKLKTESPD